METFITINKRASLRKRLSSREVEQEKINKILEAVRVSPSGRNKQPWRLIVIKDKKTIETLVTKSFSEANIPAKEAPVIIIMCANPSDALVTHGRDYYLFDCGMAMENLLLAATDLGLATNAMTGLDEEELKKILGIPDEVRFVAATPLSYPAGDSYDEAAQEKLGERTRMSLQEMVYSNSWGKPF